MYVLIVFAEDGEAASAFGPFGSLVEAEAFFDTLREDLSQAECESARTIRVTAP
jgi:hypothetical protein